MKLNNRAYTLAAALLLTATVAMPTANAEYQAYNDGSLGHSFGDDSWCLAWQGNILGVLDNIETSNYSVNSCAFGDLQVPTHYADANGELKPNDGSNDVVRELLTFNVGINNGYVSHRIVTIENYRHIVSVVPHTN